MNVAREQGLLVVEDCAQAHGAKVAGRPVGTWGHLAAFSFYPTKNLGALGAGGAVVSNDTELADRARRVREYGWKERYISFSAGINSRLDELQAAILRVNLTALDTENAQRFRWADRYFQGLDHPALTLPARPAAQHTTHVFHQFVIRLAARDQMRTHLSAGGIGSAIHYPVPVHRQPAYAGRSILPPQGLPITEKLCETILSLPMYPQLTQSKVDRVCAAILDFLETNQGRRPR